MRRSLSALVLTLLVSSCASGPMPAEERPPSPLDSYLAARAAEVETIPAGRRAQLEGLASTIAASLEADGRARLTFICTHNSRRSQMAQVWAAVAASRAGVAGVETFSGGTEVTAFNPRAVAALERAGLDVAKGPAAVSFGAAKTANAVYTVGGWADGTTLDCWSKRFDDDRNPKADFIAVMTCSDADAKCPHVAGAAERVALTYVDPKAFDGTDREAEAYDERCAQIAREMRVVFEDVARRP